jgi:hypothetical protein
MCLNNSEDVLRVEKLKFFEPHLALNPKHIATASISVDFPEPLSPTKNVISLLNATL